MSDHKREIDVLRQEIARIDGELLGALERRARAARGIGELRKDEPAALPLAERASVHALIDATALRIHVPAAWRDAPRVDRQYDGLRSEFEA